jgi:hypothetical protein
MLSDDTVLKRVSRTRWMTAGQVADDLRQCGPLAFASRDEYTAFRSAAPRRQYDAVRRVLMRLRFTRGLDCCLGSDDGREVRVFMLVDEVARRT